MAKACAYKPGVKNKEGKIVNSRLFDSLLAFFNKDRAESKKHYYIATHPDFVEAFKAELDFDDNGEVTLESYLRATDTNVENVKFLAFINKEVNSGDYDVDVAIAKAQEFTKGEYKKNYIPSLTWTNEGKVHFEIVNRDSTAEANLRDFYRKQSLHTKIIKALSNAGVGVEFLESKEAYKGRYSTLNPQKTYDGLLSLITIFGNEDVTETLAEEAGHFIYASLGTNPLVARLNTALTPEVITEIFGNELSALYNESEQLQEAAGRLIAKALLNRETPFKSLLNRIVISAKKIFSKITKNEVKKLALEADILADKMADSFLSANFEGNIETALKENTEVYSRVSSAELETFAEVKAKLNLYKRKMKTISYKCKTLYEKNVNKTLSPSTSKIKQSTTKLGIKFYSIMGIADAMSLLIDDYDRIMTKLLKIDIGSTKELNSNQLDDIKEARVYIDTANDFIEFVRKFLEGDNAITGVDPSIINGLVETYNKLKELIAHSDLKVYDETSGKKKVISMLGIIQRCEKDGYLLFLEKMMGTDFIVRSKKMVLDGLRLKAEKKDGKSVWKESLSDYLKTQYSSLYDEGTPFGYFLNAFGAIKDPTMQILNDMVSQAKRFANQRTLDYRTEILNLYDKLYEIQHGSSFDPLNAVRNPVKAYLYYETFEDGSYTGNIIQPVHWGKWERDYEAFKEKCQEEFKELYKDKPEKINTEYKRGEAWHNFFKPKYLEWHAMHSVDHGKDATVRYTPAVGDIYEDATGRSFRQKNYVNEDYYNKLSKAERDWIAEFLSLKASMDKLLGKEGHTAVHRLPQFRGELIERVQTSLQQYDGLSKARKSLKTIGEVMLEQFNLTSDDSDYGSDLHYNTPEEDFLDEVGGGAYGEALNRIPLYGINKLQDTGYYITDISGNIVVDKKFKTEKAAARKMKSLIEAGKLNSYDDYIIKHKKVNAAHKISKDPFHSLLLYGAMASNYAAMKDVANAASLGKQIYEERHRAASDKKTENSQNFIMNIKDWRIFSAAGRFDKFVEKNIFGKYNHTVIGKTSLNKIMSVLSSIGSQVMLGGNIRVGINDAAGKLYGMIKEAKLGEYISEESMRKAVAWYFKHLPEHALGVGNEKAQDPITLFKLHFNVSEMFDSKGKKISPQKARIRKILNGIPWLPLNISGGFETIMTLALCFENKVRDVKTGKITDVMSRYETIADPEKPDNKRKYFLQRGTALVDLSDEALYNFKIIESVIAKLAEFVSIPKKDRNIAEFENSLDLTEKNYLSKYSNIVRNDYDRLIKLVIKDRDSKTLSILNENKMIEALAANIMSTIAGNYSTQKRSAFQDTFIGTGALTMRGWFSGMVAEGGFSSMRYRTAFGKDWEGFFTSNFKFLVDLFTPKSLNEDATSMKLLIKALLSTLPIIRRMKWAKSAKEEFLEESNYSDNQYYNIARNTRNWYVIGQLHLLTLAFKTLALLTMGSGEDDDDDPENNPKYYTGWSRMFGILHYLTKSVRNEFLGVYAPWIAMQQAMNFTSVNAFTGIAGLIRLGELFGFGMMEVAEWVNNITNDEEDVLEEVWDKDFNNIQSYKVVNEGVWDFLLAKDDDGNIRYRNLTEDYIDENGKKATRVVTEDGIPYEYGGTPLKVPLYKHQYLKAVKSMGVEAGDSRFLEKLEKITPFWRHRDIVVDPLAAAENMLIVRDKNKR